MPLIGFTVFKDKILSGEKRQTIRPMRKYPIKMGDRLYLYWKLRTKQCEKLGEAICTEVFDIRFNARQGTDSFIFYTTMVPYSQRQITELAQMDGFNNSLELLHWFLDNYKLSFLFDMPFQAIRWSKLKK